MIPVTMESLVARFKDKPLDFKPGEKMSYSSSGYIALGHIIEKVAGEPYESFLQKNIFGPLKMSNTGYDRHDTILKNRATGYSSRNGKLVNSEYLDMTIPHAAGALYSTVEDLFTWNEALFSDKLLSAESREAMMTVEKNYYAYGLRINQQHNRKMSSHVGAIRGFNTFLARFPEEKLTIVVLRNTDYGASFPSRISQDLAAIVFGEKYELPRERVVIKVDPKIYDGYVGRYELPDLTIEVTKEGDRLMVATAGQTKLELLERVEEEPPDQVVEQMRLKLKNNNSTKNSLIHMHSYFSNSARASRRPTSTLIGLGQTAFLTFSSLPSS